MPDQEEGQPVEVHFIEDVPAEEDSFQTHSRLAKAMASAIQANRNLRVIGLLGRWGSGKSTVIKYLEDQLSSPRQTPPIDVFVYDAWLHQHDPVRRSFLETLLAHFIDRGFTTLKEWEIPLAELKRQREVSRVTSTPTFVPGGKLIALSILMLPIGIALMDFDAVKEAFGESVTTAGQVTFWAAFTAITLPFFLFAIRWALAKGTDEADEVLSLFTNKTVRTTTTKTTKSPEPTSIEFRALFRKMMAKVSNGDRRFLFVIDNLDRVDESEALQIWATVRSFFLAPEDGRDTNSVTSPIVILPVDKTSLERIFNEVRPQAGNSLVTSFVEKTFDLTFEISEPVMSDWRAFLAQKARRAFGATVNDGDIYWITRFFEESLQYQDNYKITPRKINKLINKMVALYLQRNSDEVSFESLAFYAVYVDRAEGGLIEFLTTSPPRATPSTPDWQREVAALHYGVEVKKALQVFLKEPLRSAIATTNTEEFDALRVADGFGEIFLSVVSDLPAAPGPGGPDFLFLSSSALLLGTVEDQTPYWVRESWHHLIRGHLLVEAVAPVPDDLDKRYAAFFPQLKAAQRQPFLEVSGRHISSLLNKEATSEQLKPVAVAASRLVAYARSEGLKAPSFEISENAPLFLARLLNFSRTNAEVWPLLRWSGSAESVVTALTDSLNAPPGHLTVPTTLQLLLRPEAEHLLSNSSEYDWTPLIEAAGGAARDPQSANPASPAALQVLTLLLDNDAAEKVITSMADEGHLANRLAEAGEAQNFSHMSSLVALMIYRGMDFAPPTSMTWAQVRAKHPAFLMEIVDHLRRFSSNIYVYKLWDARTAVPSSKDLIISIIEYAVSGARLGALNTKRILDDIVNYLIPLPRRLRRVLISNLARYEDFWPNLMSLDSHDNFYAVYRLLRSKSDSLARKLQETLPERMERVGNEAWSVAIKTGHQPYKLGLDVRRNSLNLPPNSALDRSLHESIPLMLTDNTDIRRRWFKLTSLLDSKARPAAIAGLGAAVRTQPQVENLVGLMKIGGADLLKEGGFAESPDETVLKVIIPNTATNAGRAWLRTIEHDVKTWSARSKGGALKALTQRISAMKKSKRRETALWAELMGDRLKLK